MLWKNALILLIVAAVIIGLVIGLLASLPPTAQPVFANSSLSTWTPTPFQPKDIYPVPETATPLPVVTPNPYPEVETPTVIPGEFPNVKWIQFPDWVPGPFEISLVCRNDGCTIVDIYCGTEVECYLKGSGGQ